MNNRKNRYKVILAFAITTSLIGMLDGGLFSTPALIGLSGLLGVYAIKKPFSARDLLKPSFVIVVLILLRISIGIMGTNIEYHEITFFDETSPVDLNGYTVKSIKCEGNKTIVRISTDRSDKSYFNRYGTTDPRAKFLELSVSGISSHGFKIGIILCKI